MSESLTPEFVRKRFERELKHAGGLASDSDRLGLRILDLVQESSEANQKIKIPELDTNIIFVDEIISYYVSFNFLLQVLVRQKVDEKSENDLPLIRSCCVVTFRIISDALAIRMLIQNGFDVQAKGLLRSLDECCEFFSALLVAPELAKEFSESQELEQSREFWHKHINKGRLRSLIDRSISGSGIFSGEEMKKWRLEERLVTMTAKHVSFISGYMAFAGENIGGSDDGQHGLFGRKSRNSIRTARYSLIVLIEPLLLMPRAFPLDLINKDNSAWKIDEFVEMVAHVKQGLAVFAKMILEFNIFRDGEI